MTVIIILNSLKGTFVMPMLRGRNMVVVACFAFLALSSLLTTLAAVSGPREGSWKEVDQAMDEGLPKTAIEKLQPIIAAALRDRAYPEAVRGIALRITLEAQIQGDRPEERIQRMEAELRQAPAEIKPVLQTIQAHWYWQYFQMNRWRFMQRTQVQQPVGDDIATWDLARILKEIDQRFQTALTDPQPLKQIPIAHYDALLERGNAPDSYRPTLYDFLVYQALEYYSASEQAGARSEDAFELSADSPIFASVEEFLAWQPTSTDQNSPTLRAIRLYQDLLRFHQEDADPAALLDADLSRLEFGKLKATGEERDTRYKAALKRFSDQHADHEISARALHLWASLLQQENDLTQARQLAQQAVARFPESIGGKRCRNLITTIEAPSAAIVTERVWNSPLPTIDITYKNLIEVHFRVVPFNFEQFVESNRWSVESLDREQQNALLRQTAVKSWSAQLPATEDYQERVEKLQPPRDLAPGSYFLIASGNADFSADNNQLSFTEFWVSDLALVVRTRQNEGIIEGLVLNAISGEPLRGATVRAWDHARNQNNRRVALPAVQTDEDGLFRFSGRDSNQLLFHATHAGHALSSANQFANRQVSQRREGYRKTFFFTDRSLYRPGQMIQYKGIHVEVGAEENDYKTVANQTLTVIFADVNEQEIARHEHRTNELGSFSGSFTAPRDRLTGAMWIYTEQRPQDRRSVQVEEYKRPKFQVELAAPTAAVRLGDTVAMTGKATSYTGAAIGGADVRWRVVRKVRFPVWWSRRIAIWPPQQGNEQEIAHGSATTELDGSFRIEFAAKPDPTVDEASEASFNFEVHADVTDSTGETRSDERITTVGFAALRAQLTAEDWQTDQQPIVVSVSTTNLDDEGQEVSGNLHIYRLKQPDQIQRPELSNNDPFDRRPFQARIGPNDEPPRSADPATWPVGEEVFQQTVNTDGAGKAQVNVPLPTGIYRAVFETRDRYGREVHTELNLQVISPDATDLSLKIPDLLAAPKWSLEPGEEFLCVWGSGYDSARAYIEIEHRGELLQKLWSEPGATQVTIKQPVREEMRGGFTVRFTMVRENRVYLHSRTVEVPWTNKQLQVRWERFRSKLQPGQQEKWQAIVTGPDAERAAAEMVAVMYDASLDAYLPHSWPSAFDVFRREHSNLYTSFENAWKTLNVFQQNWPQNYVDESLTYRDFPERIVGQMNYFAWGANRRFLGAGFGGPVALDAMAEGAEMRAVPPDGVRLATASRQDGVMAKGAGGGEDQGPDLSQVAARKDLQETAFFFPLLRSNAAGEVAIEFQIPEALTEWKFMGFAHDAQLRAGLLQDSVVTSKELMVEPNAPRFVREGDVIQFTVKVTNQSPTRQTGQVRLTLADARTGDSVDAQLENSQADQSFDLPTGQSTTLAWELHVADDLGFLTYKAVGSTGRLSDGEEGFLPVLSRRMMVTESLAMPIRGPATKEFEFTKLLQSQGSDTLQHKTLTVQMVSNPSWYAVLALPYLMEFPHECTEQTFNRLYANSLARQIANSDPKIERVFAQWRGTSALDSPLEKNQDLKGLMLEETPWVRQAMAESEARRNVGILFDNNRLNDETSRLLFKLSEQQLDDGAWSWFPGGPANDYITLYITTGFGRLRHLGVQLDMTAAVKSLGRLDAWVDRMYREIVERGKPDENHLSSTIALYLYGRSFFQQDHPIADEHRPAVDYWLGQARRYWVPLGHRQSQGHLALALHRFGDRDTAAKIMRSLKERSVSDDELGMFWRDQELSWWWYHAPIETQAVMIEAFDEVMSDQQSVQDCQVWLIKQKQTQDWKTTKATADAVYALLLRGSNLLASDELLQVTLGGELLQPQNVEAGTGFYEQRFTGGEITPQLGEITVKKVDSGVAWGSVHWQYLEDISKVTSHEGTPLKLTKQLFTKRASKEGQVLEAVDGPVKVGDELVVRVILRTDRDMEYVHLKDHRGSGTEPVTVLSQYRYQDGLAYYESTKDTASHFFIDYLPKGTYVFEYSTFVQLKGRYQTGVASIQCMYAPEFNSHSESIWLEVQ